MAQSGTIKRVTPNFIRSQLLTRQELAFIDLREEADYSGGHPLFAAQMSAGRIEMEVLDRIPRANTPIVLMDNGEGLTEPAARKLSGLGYIDVAILEGGLADWKTAGFELFEDVNSYSKAFGELVEVRRHTPSLSAQEVQALIAEKGNIAILDSRRFDEYKTMSIPTSVSVPGAELVLRSQAAAPQPETTIIVNCAGRTRSIIGTQSLINAGIANRVFALRNGTIGWLLAGQALEHGQARRVSDVGEDLADRARLRAREVSYRAGVRRLRDVDLKRLEADKTRTLYRFDVRTPEDYRAGHIPEFSNVQGGQLVQEIDMHAPVRGARIVLSDPLGSRADMTASWLAQMGWEVYVLDEWPGDTLIAGEWKPTLPPRPQVSHVEVAELESLLRQDQATVIDLAPSPGYNAGHIPGAKFAIRARLPAFLASLPLEVRRLIFTSTDGILAEFAAADINENHAVNVLRGGTQAWVAAGRPVERATENVTKAGGDVYKRPYEGTDNATAAMQAYLDWEAGLVDQLERDGTHGFFVI